MSRTRHKHPDYETCPECDGTGERWEEQRLERCENCDGAGEIEWDEDAHADDEGDYDD